MKCPTTMTTVRVYIELLFEAPERAGTNNRSLSHTETMCDEQTNTTRITINKLKQPTSKKISHMENYNTEVNSKHKGKITGIHLSPESHGNSSVI